MDGQQLQGLVSAARAGDRAAFEQLVAGLQGMAIAVCYGRLGRRELAREAAQEAFIDAYLHLSQLSEPTAFMSWFRRVLGKHCDRKSRRKAWGSELLALDLEHAGPASQHEAEASLLRKERSDLSWSLVEALPAHERTVVALFYFAQASLRDIAMLLEVAENTIKQRLHSARKRMKENGMTQIIEGMKTADAAQDARFVHGVAIFLAIRSGDEGRVRQLIGADPSLLEAREDWDASSFSERDVPMAAQATPLIRAAEQGHVGIVRSLLAAGAHVDGDCGCATQETPLWAAVVTGQLQTARELLAHGANPNACARSGISCLQAAAMRGERGLVALLLEHGADRAHVDREGRSAADWAALKQHGAIAEQLGAGAGPQGPSAETRGEHHALNVHPTGIKALDLFAPLRRGAIALVSGGAGVGRNIFLAELAQAAHRRGDCACVWVTWQREAWSDAEFDQLLNETDLHDSVHVLRQPHDGDPGAARERPAQAIELAERLLAQGKTDVLITFLERPGVRTAIETVLPRLGVREDGSAITALIVPPWQQAGSRDEVLGPPFDTLLAFDPALAAARCFPALDPQRSEARALTAPGFDPHHAQLAQQAKRLLHAFAHDADALSETERKRAVRLRAYLTQPFGVAEPFVGRVGASVPRAELLADVRAILAGELDDEPEATFWYRGALRATPAG